MLIPVAIAAAEIGFWALVLGGLAARYVLHRRRLSTVMLAAVPVVDLLLLTVTAIDLARGAEAGWSHGLAAVYLGFSVALGPSLIASLDRRFAGLPAPPVDEWRLWSRAVLACGISAALLGALMLIGGTTALAGWFGQLGAIAVLWLVFGPLWSSATAYPRRGRSRRST
jgi:hypothetical protein